MSGFPFAARQAQMWVGERVGSGDIVIDATAGGGSDTLFLARCAGANGLVYAFDVQEEALEMTRTRLETYPQQAALAPVYLVPEGHERMEERVSIEHEGKIAAVMFNLGWLPGSSSPLITRAETTIPALDAALRLLAPGGIITVVVYPGHEGGKEEADAVDRWAARLPAAEAQAVSYHFPQKSASPYVIAVVKR